MILFNWFAVGLIPFVILDADSADGSSHPDLLLQHDRVRGGGPHDLSRRRPVLAPRCLPPGTGPRADPTVQRSRVGDLHQSVRYSDRAERDPRPGDLLRPPGPTGLQAMGRAFQSAHRRRDGPRFLRRAGVHGAACLGRPADVLGPKHRDRPLDRRHGRRSRPGDPSTAGRRRGWPHERDSESGTMPDQPAGLAASPDRLALASQPEARAVDRLVDDGRLLPAVRPVVLRGHAHTAPAKPRWEPARVVQWFGDNTIGCSSGSRSSSSSPE